MQPLEQHPHPRHRPELDGTLGLPRRLKRKQNHLMPTSVQIQLDLLWVGFCSLPLSSQRLPEHVPTCHSNVAMCRLAKEPCAQLQLLQLILLRFLAKRNPAVDRYMKDAIRTPGGLAKRLVVTQTFDAKLEDEAIPRPLQKQEVARPLLSAQRAGGQTLHTRQSLGHMQQPRIKTLPEINTTLARQLHATNIMLSSTDS